MDFFQERLVFPSSHEIIDWIKSRQTINRPGGMCTIALLFQVLIDEVAQNCAHNSCSHLVLKVSKTRDVICLVIKVKALLESPWTDHVLHVHGGVAKPSEDHLLWPMESQASMAETHHFTDVKSVKDAILLH